jgi:hypothetical protein
MSCTSLRASGRLFILGIKRPAEGGHKNFCFGGFWGAFALKVFLGFGLVLLLWAFWCGKLLEEKRITEGKRVAKEELVESLHGEL